MTVADESVKKKSNVVSFPTEIVEEILSRLPVKSILRSRSVSKPWLSLISTPSFNKLQFTRATQSSRTGLFVSAYDSSTHRRYYLSAAKDGGPLTKLMTVKLDTRLEHTGLSHLHGLVSFTSYTFNDKISTIYANAFVVNPSTRKIFELPDMNCEDNDVIRGYVYGIDESRNERKILFIKGVVSTTTFEFMIFSLSSYSWRKIDAELPVGFDWSFLPFCLGGVGGVCVDSVVYFMHNGMLDAILAFDFATEKFEVISIPLGFLPTDVNLDEEDVGLDEEDVGVRTAYRPYITKINGCLGAVIHDKKRSEVRIWLLKDYDKRVWVKETIKFPKSWNDLIGRVPPTIDVNMEDEIVFSLSKVTENVITVPVYSMKSKCFRSLHFTLDDQLASSKTVKICHISCYVETIMPLKDNWSKTSNGNALQ